MVSWAFYAHTLVYTWVLPEVYEKMELKVTVYFGAQKAF